MVGLRREEVIGRSVEQFVAPEDRQRAVENSRSAQEVVTEYQLVLADGSRITIEAHGRPSQPIGSGVRYTAVRDITARKQREEQLHQLTEDLKRSNRDLEQFAYVASHDLQEPLRAVGGYMKLLERRLADALDDRGREYIAGAFEGAMRMERLIRDLLTFSRIGTRGGSLVPTGLDTVLQQSLENLQAGIHSAQAVVTHDPLPTLVVDGSQIMQVFQNLIGNAIKFHGEQPPKIHVGAEEQDGRWVFSVRDNGIGIEPQYFERIFQIFQRLHTRKRYSGTGIGLAICKKIVERHGGALWVESQPGKGSTFYFSIPTGQGGASLLPA
jgi:light-regulated signal transduction histidine kinase (bacteriophytochrome)